MTNATNIQAIATRVIALIDNGVGEMGIAAGGDRALPGVRKMHLAPNSLPLADRISHSISHVDATLMQTVFWGPVICAAIGFIHRNDLLDEDSDDIIADTANGRTIPTARVDADHVTAAATIIFATKINLFSRNHHVGQGALTAYVSKVFSLICRPHNADADIARTCMHMIGHWCSTVKAWYCLGITGVRVPNSFAVPASIRISDDMSIRTVGIPAGCARIGLGIAICRKLVGSSLYSIVHNMDAITELTDTYRTILSAQACYHVGSAHFGTSQERVELSSAAASFVDDLIICITRLYPRSTLARSPLIPSNLNDLENYNEALDTACRAYVANAHTVRNQAIESLAEQASHEFVPLSAEDRERVKRALSAAVAGANRRA